MNTQFDFDDELDLGTLESTSKKKFTKTLGIPEGRSTFRILPAPSKKEPIAEMWYNWFKFNTVTDDGDTKTIWTTGRSDPANGKNNPIRAKQEAVARRKAELESPYLEVGSSQNGNSTTTVNEEKMPPEVLAEYKKLKAADRYLKASRHCFAHAVTLEGEAVILRFPRTVADLIRKELNRLKEDGESLNPLSLSDSTEVVTMKKSGRTGPAFGVWFDFNREGKGLQTKYSVAVRKHRKKVEVNGKTLFDESYDHTPVPEDVKNSLMTNYIDLESTIPVYSNDELVRILKGDKSVVDAKRGFGKAPAVTAMESAPVETGDVMDGLSLSDDEITTSAEDDIPTIEL